MKEEVINAAIAGLLHDVGKLEQRARLDPWNPAPGVERAGQPVHATWTTYFVQTYIPAPYRAAALAGAYHHSPQFSPAQDQHLSTLVALADRLTAGERADPDEKEDHPPQQMVTIFDRVTGASSDGEKKHYLPLHSLALDQAAIFPSLSGPIADPGACYQNLAEGLRAAARQNIPDPLSYLENILGALQRYTWAVPSAYYHSVPDVSLYDHCRMTAALSACLVGLENEYVERLLDAVQRDFQGQAKKADLDLLKQPLALLVGGDISGIQDFIYTISSKGAAQTLRGRSLYLQMLTEAVLRFTLSELSLPYSNVIYSGGGHFFLLAPLSAAEQLPGIRRTVTQKLIAHHGVSLYLAIGSAPVPACGFRLGAFPYYWDAMHRDLAHIKQRRYTELQEDMVSQVLEPPRFGGNPDEACSVCGEDHRPVSKWDIESETQERICSLCKSFIDDLGKPLPAAHFIALGFGPSQEDRRHIAANALRAFGMQVQFLENAAQPVQLENIERIVLWALDDMADDNWPVTGSKPAARLLHYTVNRIPRKPNGQPYTFDELQDQTTGGFKRLGVLRMDVDNLGDIFKYGLGASATLARLSTLSFQMSLFFEGWVKRICESDAYQGLIYAVYAGGDDGFLIGPWDRMPALARQIAQDFASYTAHHPSLHISAGLAFIGGKYPIYQAADDAGHALHQAKDLPGKQAFSFLGKAWPWDVLAQLDEKKNRLLQIVTKKDLGHEGLEGPQSILQILQQLAIAEAKQSRCTKGRPVWGPWQWRGAYLLHRMTERYAKSNPALAEAIDQVRQDLGKNDYQEIHQWGAAARWVQLLTRKRPDE